MLADFWQGMHVSKSRAKCFFQTLYPLIEEVIASASGTNIVNAQTNG